MGDQFLKASNPIHVYKTETHTDREIEREGEVLA